MISTAPALKAALKTALLARNVVGLDVTYGAPSRKPGGDLIYLGNITSDEESAAIGNLRREEAYTLTVIVSIPRAFADDPQTSTERAFVLYEELMDLLRDDMSVGNAVRTAEPVGWALEEMIDEAAQEREARITVRILCKARI